MLTLKTWFLFEYISCDELLFYVVFMISFERFPSAWEVKKLNK